MTNFYVQNDVSFAASPAGTYNGPLHGNPEFRGIMVFIILGTVTSATVTVNIQFQDIGSGTFITALSSTGIAAAGNSTLTVYPGVTAAANVAISSPLPTAWRISVGVVGASAAVTGSVSLAVLG